MHEYEDIICREALRVLLEALTASYLNLHDILDLLRPDSAELSSTLTAVAHALRLLGSSGAQALGLPPA